jgi:hypothetical protein
MNNRKILLLILLFVIISCTCLGIISYIRLSLIEKSIPLVTETSESLEISEQPTPTTATIQYSIPVGYSEIIDDHLDGSRSYLFTSDTSADTFFLLVEFPADTQMNSSTLISQVQQTMNPVAIEQGIVFSLVDQIPFTLKGQEVILSIREGDNFEGRTYRELSAVYDNGNNPVVFLVFSPLDTWNQEIVNSFIASIQ